MSSFQAENKEINVACHATSPYIVDFFGKHEAMDNKETTKNFSFL